MKVIIIIDHLPIIKEENKKKLSLSVKANFKIQDIFHFEDWLWYFSHSKSIFTDSYHSTIFSILFQKPFISLKNKIRGGERFISLLRPLNLLNRLFETPDCINKYNLY